LAAQKKYAEAIAAMNKRPQRKTSTDVYWLSSLYAGNGEKEKALATLQEAFELGFRDFATIDANAAFSGLRDDPQFQDMVRRYSK